VTGADRVKESHNSVLIWDNLMDLKIFEYQADLILTGFNAPEAFYAETV